MVGGGFAGVEAAWAIAQRGGKVRLYEMRPVKTTPAHKTDFLAELVCSNSFKSQAPTSPAGLLKEEMLALGSLVIPVALANQVPGGEALAVDRDAFASEITRRIEGHPGIEIVRQEFDPKRDLETGPTIFATGPLTSPAVSDWLATLLQRGHLYFYDAVSPTVEASSLDESIVFAQSRYDKGGDDYLNCPFEKDSYYAFVEALKTAERAPIHGFEAEGGEAELVEKIKYFAGCTPIEAIADGGDRSLAFGNFKPVGLVDPRTGRRPYAALQLRPENREKSLYSLVACQTRLKWGEQKRVFRMVPGLEDAEFVRFGVIHKNAYIEAPKALTSRLELRDADRIFVAGQLTGVEGYLESAAMGIWAGIAAIDPEASAPPRESAYGSLISHLQDDTPREFAPMNINWGLLPEPEQVTRDKGVKRALKLEKAREMFGIWLEKHPGLRLDSNLVELAGT